MFKISELSKDVFGPQAVFLSDRDVTIKNVEHDTRRIQKGALYVALKGENHDGHDFVKDAEAKGAAACLVDRKIVGIKMSQIIVPDTLYAYGELARFWRGKIKYPLLGMTGSNGKTTTKDLLFTMLSHGKRVHRTVGNFNNLIGVPYTLLSFPLDADVGIVEMGMNAKGEIARLAQITEPDVGLITNIGRAHIGRLGSIEAVLSAKMELFEHMLKNKDSVLIVNMSDPMISGWASKHVFGGKITYQTASHVQGIQTDVSIEQIKDGVEEQEFRITLSGGKTATGSIRLSGLHNLANVSAAVTASLYFGMDLDDCISSLKDFVPPAMRSTMQLRDGVRYLVDCYNANPDSMMAAIEAGKKIQDADRHIAVIGDMFELDDFSPQLHEEVGAFLAQKKYDRVFAIGKYARDYERGFLKRSTEDKISVYEPNEMDRLKKEMRLFVQSGDFVLVKASRGMKLETVLE